MKLEIIYTEGDKPHPERQLLYIFSNDPRAECLDSCGYVVIKQLGPGLGRGRAGLESFLIIARYILLQ